MLELTSSISTERRLNSCKACLSFWRRRWKRRGSLVLFRLSSKLTLWLYQVVLVLTVTSRKTWLHPALAAYGEEVGSSAEFKEE